MVRAAYFERNEYLLLDFMSKIKILFFTHNLNRTGAEVVLYQLAVRLNPDRFDIGILLLGESGDLIPELPAHIRVFKLHTTYQLTDKIRHYLGEDLLFKQIQSIQKNHGYSIWYINTIRPAHLLKYAPRFKVKTISHIHELASNYSNLSSQVFADILKSDSIIACSDLVLKEISLAYDGDVITINSAIDKSYINSFNIQKESKVVKRVTIVCAGSISDRKGTDIFLEVAQQLKNSKYDFVWLGQFADTGFSNWIKKTHRKLNLSHVTFISPRSQHEYYSLLGQADLYFSTSREESLGLAMMEAIYLGKPVIALNSGGSNLIITESNGFVIDSFDGVKIAEVLRDFVEVKLSDFKDKVSVEILDNFDLESEFIRWENLLKKIAL